MFPVFRLPFVVVVLLLLLLLLLEGPYWNYIQMPYPCLQLLQCHAAKLFKTLGASSLPQLWTVWMSWSDPFHAESETLLLRKTSAQRRLKGASVRLFCSVFIVGLAVTSIQNVWLFELKDRRCFGICKTGYPKFK